MKIALAQMKMCQNKNENYKHTIEFIKKASENNADLICFPEIQLSQFFPQYKNANVNVDDVKYLNGIQEACNKYDIYASPNLYFRENNKNYDMSFLINNFGEIIGSQKMVHIEQAEKFYEQNYYTPSDDGFNVFNTPFGKIAIVICYDRHYPESIRTQAINGAQLILIPTANTFDEPTEMFMWEIKVQAFQNSLHIAMCNRVGREDKMEFCGQSIVVNSNGDTVAISDSDEGLLFAEINLNVDKRYLNLRRKELYE